MCSFSPADSWTLTSANRIPSDSHSDRKMNDAKVHREFTSFTKMRANDAKLLSEISDAVRKERDIKSLASDSFPSLYNEESTNDVRRKFILNYETRLFASTPSTLPPIGFFASITDVVVNSTSGFPQHITNVSNIASTAASDESLNDLKLLRDDIAAPQAEVVSNDSHYETMKNLLLILCVLLLAIGIIRILFSVILLVTLKS